MIDSLPQGGSPFNSFWMGGFEGADHINAQQNELDMVQGSGHLAHLDTDFSSLAALQILTARESVGWRISQPTRNSKLDLSRAITTAKAAEKQGVQLIWTFMHYGTPLGISLLDDSFVDHFVTYATEVAKALKPFSQKPIYNLINEISFLSWAVSQTDYIHPYKGVNEGAGGDAARLGFEVKCRLVRAVLKAMDAVRDVSPDARFLHVEPLLHVVHPEDRPDLKDLAIEIRGHQWQTWELLKGTMEPQLGGYAEALDLMGVNYYFNGQMEVPTDKHLDWLEPDPRRVPLNELLKETWDRYQRPLIISETGHFGEHRARWLKEVVEETILTLERGIPLQGVCIYPIIDRPCWHDPSKIIDCGIFKPDRRHRLDYTKTLRRGQRLISRK